MNTSLNDTNYRDTMDEILIQDVIAMAVPPAVGLGNGTTPEEIVPTLDVIARKNVWAQYVDNPPQGLVFRDIEWLISNELAAIEEFQPAHDCQTCREGNEKAYAFLSEYPGRWLAMGNIEYLEFWPMGARAVPGMQVQDRL